MSKKTETITKEEFQSLKRYLEKGRTEDGNKTGGPLTQPFPSRFFESFILQGVQVHLIEPARLICSIKLHPGLLNDSNFLHNGATVMLVDVVGSTVLYTVGASMDRVSVDINVSYVDFAYAGEEIEIEAKVLGVGKAIGVASVELRKKNTGKIIAHGRHTLYLAVPSKL